MRTDEEIREKVLSELAWEPRLDGAEIRAIVRGGVVTLGGVVTTYAAKALAETAAARIDGVMGIMSAIIVDLPSLSVRSDAELKRAAIVALEWNVHVPPNAVSVAVENGWVELRGTFDHAHQREAAEATIAQLMGVRGIANRIVIRSERAGGTANSPELFSASAR
jgi:osmotically-inducible protein OsmY